MNKVVFSLFLLLTAFIFSMADSFAQTNVRGEANGIWNLEGSPYLIVGEIVVPEGDTLIIHPGVEVIAEVFTPLNVHGVLFAVGTEDDSIRFTSDDEIEGWGGIRFFDADEGSTLDYCVVTKGIASHGEGHGAIGASGGNVLICRSEVEVRRSRFSHGYARGFGGGMTIWESSTSVIDCIFSENEAAQNGGGMEIFNGSEPFIHRCVFNNNSTPWTGGGICIEQNSNPVILECSFIENNAAAGGGFGVYFASSPEVLQCEFIENQAMMGGAAYLRNEGSRPLIEWCYFYRNQAMDGEARAGGAITVRDFAAPEIRYNRFIENEAHIAGAIMSWDLPLSRIHHNLFLRNEARAGGALGIRGYDAELTLVINNCTFLDNLGEGEESNVAFIYEGARLRITSSIIWGAEPHFWHPERVEVDYSHIRFGRQGEGNSEENPMLFESDSTWALLRGDSPCVDSGRENLPRDPDGSRNDRGWLHVPNDAYEGFDQDSLSVWVTPNGRRDVELSFVNETGVPIYVSPMESWVGDDDFELNSVTEITGDHEINGVAVTPDGYFLCGSANGEGPNQVYCVDTDFNMDNQFDQPGVFEGPGYLDMAWGGEIILYGGDPDQVVEFTTGGEFGGEYVDPAGYNSYGALAADLSFNVNEIVDVYLGSIDGEIVLADEEMWVRERFDVGLPVSSLGVKGNKRALYITSRIAPGLYLLSLFDVESQSMEPLFKLTVPFEGFDLGGIEVTQALSVDRGTLVGIWRGADEAEDQMFSVDIYYSWLIVNPGWRLLMPGEATTWDVTIAGDQVPEGEYDGEFFLAVNGFAGGRSIPVHMTNSVNSIDDRSSAIPNEISLYHSYPNPFNSITNLSFFISDKSEVILEIFDSNGIKTSVLYNGVRNEGRHTLLWNAERVPTGIYFGRLNVDGRVVTRKMTLLR